MNGKISLLLIADNLFFSIKTSRYGSLTNFYLAKNNKQFYRSVLFLKKNSNDCLICPER